MSIEREIILELADRSHLDDMLGALYPSIEYAKRLNDIGAQAKLLEALAAHANQSPLGLELQHTPIQALGSYLCINEPVLAETPSVKSVLWGDIVANYQDLVVSSRFDEDINSFRGSTLYLRLYNHIEGNQAVQLNSLDKHKALSRPFSFYNYTLIDLLSPHDISEVKMVEKVLDQPVDTEAIIREWIKLGRIMRRGGFDLKTQQELVDDFCTTVEETSRLSSKHAIINPQVIYQVNALSGDMRYTTEHAIRGKYFITGIVVQPKLFDRHGQVPTRQLQYQPMLTVQPVGESAEYYQTLGMDNLALAFLIPIDECLELKIAL
jgi:hypothetical protein